MKIQMAGIRTVEDAKMCIENGIDIIGLLVGQTHNSDDFISKELAKEIQLALPKGTETTLITHLENAKEIIDIARFIGTTNIQLHSPINEDEVEKIHKALPKIKLLRLIHISDNIITDIDKIKFVDYYFTDSFNIETNQAGGTGLIHNWEIDKELIQKLKKPVFIAGGLNPSNVAKIICKVKPFGVDVNTGCRGKNGLRDVKKVKVFVKSIRGVEL